MFKEYFYTMEYKKVNFVVFKMLKVKIHNNIIHSEVFSKHICVMLLLLC